MKIKIYFIITFLYSTVLEIDTSYVTDTIQDDLEFYYKRLSKRPSKLATTKYSFICNNAKRGLHMELYTRGNHVNIQRKCSWTHYVQLLNEKLNILADNIRECQEKDGFTKYEGTRIIQDYLPRHYYFSFGIKCGSKIGSLKGLSYNISISGQSNHTECSFIPKQSYCLNYYSHTSLPNLIGGHDLWKIIGETDNIYRYYGVFQSFLNGPCYQHYKELTCYVTLPKCDAQTGQIIVPCEETCREVLDACFEDVRIVAEKLSRDKEDHQASTLWTRLQNHEHNKSTLLGCDYLPKMGGSIPCFYKPITCSTPPSVANAKPSVTIERDRYNVSSQIEYICESERFFLTGNNSVTCLNSGEWSLGPKCEALGMSPLVVVLPVLILSCLIFIRTIIGRKCRREGPLVLYIRNRQYDAFVSYRYDGNDLQFAEDTIRKELEEKLNPPLKLCIHRRDFLAACDIKWNIMNAIRNSNSAIIVMSQNYVNSLWCLEEFEDCYIENMKDSAFKLFVILLQPAKSLNVTNEYIICFLSRKTYLERDDPDLFKKMSKYLIWVKNPRKDWNQKTMSNS